MPSEMAMEPGPLGEVGEPVTEERRPALVVMLLKEDVRHRVGGLAVLSTEFEGPLNQLTRRFQLVHLVVREGMPTQEPPVITDGRGEVVELVEHALALVDTAAIEVAAQPLQHDRRITRCIGEMFINQRRRLGRLAARGRT